MAKVCLTRWVHVLAQLVTITLWETLLSCPLKNENSIVHSELLTIFEPNASVHTLFHLFFSFSLTILAQDTTMFFSTNFSFCSPNCSISFSILIQLQANTFTVITCLENSERTLSLF